MVTAQYPLFAASTTDKILNALFDDTFAGIHQLTWFDWAILLPYFGTLLILSLYGLHRYKVIHEYFKAKKRLNVR